MYRIMLGKAIRSVADREFKKRFVAPINARLFKPLGQIPLMPFQRCAEGQPTTVSLLLGCRSISYSVVKAFLHTYEPGDKVIVSGGERVEQENVGKFLARSGKLDEAYSDIEAKTLRERFTTTLKEARYMYFLLKENGVKPQDIIEIDLTSTNTGEQIAAVKDTLAQFKGVTIYTFSASAMRALMTARHESNSELDDVAISVVGANAFGITPNNWHKHPWLWPFIRSEYKKIGPEGTRGSYVGKHCSEVDLSKEAEMIRALRLEG